MLITYKRHTWEPCCLGQPKPLCAPPWSWPLLSPTEKLSTCFSYLGFTSACSIIVTAFPLSTRHLNSLFLNLSLDLRVHVQSELSSGLPLITILASEKFKSLLESQERDHGLSHSSAGIGVAFQFGAFVPLECIHSHQNMASFKAPCLLTP